MNSTGPQRVFVLEGKVDVKPIGYDHVFSFFSNPADSFLHDYFPESFVHALYDEEFNRVVDFLERERTRHPFYYRKVDLLWCFKKTLIEFAFYVRYHVEALRRLTTFFKDAYFYVEDVPEILQYPSLAAMAKNDPSLAGRICFVDGKQGQSVARPAERSRGNKFLYKPKHLSFGKIKEARAAFFSDFEKCKAVLANVQGMFPVIFCNTIAPRMFFRSFELHFALWQSEYDPAAHAQKYTELSKTILAFLSDYRGFDRGHFPGPLGPLLSHELKRLMEMVLPKLIFEIDSMCDFFAEAISLEQVLVDEDASPAKSAFCQIARLHNISSVVECHGAMSRKNGLLPLSADKILVWGAAQKNKLISWGCPPQSIIVTGCSRYAPYQKMDAVRVRKKVAKQLRLRIEEPMILFAPPTLTIGRGRWFLDEKIYQNIYEALKAFEVFLKEYPKAQLIIKIHAGDENVPMYRRWAKKNQGLATIRIVEKFDPLLLAKAVDFLVVYNSTYAVEGFALEKPVLYLFADDDQMITEMREFNVFLYPRNMQEMLAIMRRLVDFSWQLPPRWKEARAACLNESSVEPAVIIASLLQKHNKGK